MNVALDVAIEDLLATDYLIAKPHLFSQSTFFFYFIWVFLFVDSFFQLPIPKTTKTKTFPSGNLEQGS